MAEQTEQISMEAVKALLRQRQMTFEDLATRIGKERSVVYKTIANGNPTFSFIVKLMEVLETDFDSLRSEPEPAHTIDGFVEVDGHIFRIHSRADLARAHSFATKACQDEVQLNVEERLIKQSND